ncbi:MAG: dihydrodipicolinate synthase family protein [Thaumarchaeota archaeon]|nr:dihydrodipicolinate synthase family protein [Nitrososphaerota archaeon]
MTPMKEDFEVDYEQLEDYVRWLVKHDIGGVAVNVDTGEGPHLYPEERVNILKVFSEIVPGGIPVIAGLHARNTMEAVRLGLEAKEAGADGLLVFPHPAFAGEPNESVICNYHSEISGKVDLPIIIFQLQPALGGVDFTPETLLRLASIKNVIAIKEASFDARKFVNVVHVLKKASRKIMILTGNDNFIYESLVLGAEGGLLGFGTIAVEQQVEMFNLIAKGRLTEAREIWEELIPLEEAIFAQPVRDYRARLKEALVMMGVLKTSYVRPPLQPVSEKEREAIKQALRSLRLV